MVAPGKGVLLGTQVNLALQRVFNFAEGTSPVSLGPNVAAAVSCIQEPRFRSNSLKVTSQRRWFRCFCSTLFNFKVRT